MAKQASPWRERLVESLLMAGVGIPLLGVLMGGVYSWPAIALCKGREPCLTGSLAAGLAVTVFGLGHLLELPLRYCGAVWAASILLLLAARRLHGSLDGNLERFGLVHAPTLMAMLLLSLLSGPRGP